MWDRHCALCPTRVSTGPKRVGAHSPKVVLQLTPGPASRPIVRPDGRHRRAGCRLCATTRPARGLRAVRLCTPVFAGSLLQKQSEKSSVPARPTGRTCHPHHGTSREKIGAFASCRRPRRHGRMPGAGRGARAAASYEPRISGIGAPRSISDHPVHSKGGPAGVSDYLPFVVPPARLLTFRGKAAPQLPCLYCGFFTKQKNHDHRCDRRPGLRGFAAGR